MPRRTKSHHRRPATTEPELESDPVAAPEPDDPGLEDGSGPQAGEPDAETGPLRRCVVTRERQAKERMIRFVLSPERVIVPDLTARLPGRGMWLSARADVLETARAQGSLARGFAKYAAKAVAEGAAQDAAKPGAKVARGLVTLTPDLPDLIEAMLLRRVVELLGLARRAGQAVCGFQKAREWLTNGRAGLVVQASDGSVDERARFLSGAATTDFGAAGGGDAGPEESGSEGPGPEDGTAKAGIPVGSPLPATSLGAVFGRDHVVHVVVAPGRLAVALTNEIARLAGVTRRAEPGRKDAKAGPKAAGGDAGKIEAGQTGQDRDINQRAGA